MQVSTFFFLNGVVFDFYQLIIDYWIGIIGFCITVEKFRKYSDRKSIAHEKSEVMA
jgi:hypothetical protein